MKSSRCSAPALGACVLAATLALAPRAQAGSAVGPPTEVVRFADLNLNTAQGVRILYGRIRRAARDVCAPLEPASTLIPSAAWRSCFEQAITTAVRRVDRPLLTAYHLRQEGHA